MYSHISEGAVVEVGKARVHGPAVGEVESLGQVHVALHPERVERVGLVGPGRLDAGGLHHHARVFQLKSINIFLLTRYF